MEFPKDYNLSVGLRIRELREDLDYTREQFSALCDISESFLSVRQVRLPKRECREEPLRLHTLKTQLPAK